MKVIGIIAEYNPFHNGHKYQIDELKRRTEADYVIIAMSGNFLQRGVPALCDKYTRTRMALSCGADLVLELPSVWATASAEYFAHGGVHLLHHTGVVTHLGFGAETDNPEALRCLSSILKEEPVSYKKALSVELKKGNPFPTARKNALLSIKNEYPFGHFPLDTLDELLDAPNNILALEYLKALPETMIPVLIQRKGAGYHDSDINNPLPSATAIREAVFNSSTSFAQAMPAKAYAILQECAAKNALIHSDDLSDIIGYRLLSSADEGYAEYADCNPEISNKIRNHLKNYSGFGNFCQTLKSRDLTYTRISRLLLHILLDIRQTDYVLGKELGYAPYLRVLGFCKDAAPLLNAIKKEASVPLITKAADAASLLSPEAYSFFKKDLYVSSVYQQIMTVRKQQPPANDYTSPIVIIEA